MEDQEITTQSGMMRLGNSDLLSEYNAVVSRLNSLDGWAHGFVALYFAFTGALMALAGVLYLRADKSSGIVEASYYYSVSVQSDISPKTAIALIVIAALGIFLTLWAVLMNFDYSGKSEHILNHARSLEIEMGRSTKDVAGFASMNLLHRERPLAYVQSIMVAGVFLIFFFAWVGILVDALDSGESNGLGPPPAGQTDS